MRVYSKVLYYIQILEYSKVLHIKYSQILVYSKVLQEQVKYESIVKYFIALKY